MFLSGFSALIYEISWLRLMSLTLGSTAYATSCALAIFLLGLAVGAYLGGKEIDILKYRPLKAYGLVEVCIGISSLAISPLLIAAPKLILAATANAPSANLNYVLLIALFSCLIMLIPTIFMGATLPIVLKQIGEYASPKRSFAFIYGLNTLGAVFGSLAAAFIGFSYLGIQNTILAAIIINLFIGTVSFLFAKQFTLPGSSQSKTDLQAFPLPEDNVGDQTQTFPLATICLLAFSSGYASLTFEVVWVRLLRFFENSLTYTFTIMISTFLLGLCLGSFIYERFIEHKDKTIEEKLLRFANLQYLAAIASSGCLIGIPICLMINMHIGQNHGSVFAEPLFAFSMLFLNGAVCILLPATLLGLLFPLLGSIAASTKRTEFASKVGIVYAANTIGCVLGAVVSGLILIPRFGSYDTFQLAVLFSVACAAWAISKNPHLDKTKKLAITIIPVLIATAFYLFVKLPFYHFFHTEGKDKILFYGEDNVGTMFIIYFPGNEPVENLRQIVVNGSCLATTVMPSRRYMRLLGHLPALIHPKPNKALIACYGTGTTAGSLSIYPDIKQLDIVELSPMIIKNAYLFADTNHMVLENPKTKVHIEDARNYLLRHIEKYDLISMEPPPPIEAGIVNLYTTEFYQLISQRLNDDGIYAQWVPMHEPPAKLWKMMIKSAVEVFPHVSIWLPTSGEAILLASKSPITFNIEQARKKIAESKIIQDSLKDVGFTDAESILSTYIVSDKQLQNLLGELPPVTDNKPALEFFLPYLGPFLTDDQLIKQGSSDITEIVPDRSNLNRQSLERHRNALLLSFTPIKHFSNEKKKALFDQIDILEPNNNMYRFLRLVNLQKR